MAALQYYLIIIDVKSVWIKLIEAQLYLFIVIRNDLSITYLGRFFSVGQFKGYLFWENQTR